MRKEKKAGYGTLGAARAAASGAVHSAAPGAVSAAAPDTACAAAYDAIIVTVQSSDSDLVD